MAKQPDDQPPMPQRRDFFRQSAMLSFLAVTPGAIAKAADAGLDESLSEQLAEVPLKITVNGKTHQLRLDPRITLLDLLRERLHLTGTKKGCDYGQCGSCTVLKDGKRVLSCMSLAVMQQNKNITTIEGLANGDELHPMQKAFLEKDGFQCGYCTPGQIMSGIACINEGHAGSPEEIRQYMSGNICRCGAYTNIVDAIYQVKQEGGTL